jgi:hypothetical protein
LGEVPVSNHTTLFKVAVEESVHTSEFTDGPYNIIGKSFGVDADVGGVDVGDNLVLIVAYKHTYLTAVAQTVRGQEFGHVLCVAHLLARLIVGVEHMAVEGIEPQSALCGGGRCLVM